METRAGGVTAAGSGSRRRRTGAGLAALVLAGGLALGGCGASSSGSKIASSAGGAGVPQAAQGGVAKSAAGAAAPAGAPAGAAGAGTAGKSSVTVPPSVETGRSIIYTGEIQLRTRGTGGADGVDAAVARAETLVRTAGGYIDSELSGSDNLLSGYYGTEQPVPGGADTGTDSGSGTGSAVGSPALPAPSDVSGESAQLVLRVPVDSYDTVYQQLLALGTVLAHQRQAQDVTQQVVDVSSRVKTQQASVARVRALMDRAGSITDVTTLEQDLTQREADLESLESQLSALKAETAMSTVTVQIYSKAVPRRQVQPPKKSGGLSVFGALKGGWHALYETVRALLIALAAALPFLVPLGLLLWLLRVFLRRRTLPAVPGHAPAFVPEGPDTEGPTIADSAAEED